MIEIMCQRCGKRSHVPEALLGQVVKCRGCGGGLDVKMDDGEYDRRVAEYDAAQSERMQKEQEKLRVEMGGAVAGSETLGDMGFDSEMIEQQARFSGLSDAVRAFQGGGEVVDGAEGEGWQTHDQSGGAYEMDAELGEEMMTGGLRRYEGVGATGAGVTVGMGAVLGGAMAAVVGGVLWAALSVMLGMELGVVAFLLGAGVCWVLVKMVGQRHWMLAVMAVVLAGGGMGVGKLGVALLALEEMKARVSVGDDRIVEAAVVMMLVADGSFDAETAERFKDIDWEKKQRVEMKASQYAKVSDVMMAMTDEEQLMVVREYLVKPRIAKMSPKEKVVSMVSYRDGFWVGLMAIGAIGVVSTKSIFKRG
ncbi:hypothetical protein KS4_24460 [Poriferisphaera corsica]|uniref:Uncharacterized protein n=1 Tax=Poriferisphaera corsica TaxID=2528020 RepID=A0A517YVX0_9BACT|nr:hypothetical protein [Poriferisphaera corsica]QDU34378.1 hypothetical protein KS4_24460 [Poriferisphaera corsica]